MDLDGPGDLACFWQILLSNKLVTGVNTMAAWLRHKTTALVYCIDTDGQLWLKSNAVYYCEQTKKQP